MRGVLRRVRGFNGNPSMLCLPKIFNKAVTLLRVQLYQADQFLKSEANVYWLLSISS